MLIFLMCCVIIFCIDESWFHVEHTVYIDHYDGDTDVGEGAVRHRHPTVGGRQHNLLH